MDAPLIPKRPEIPQSAVVLKSKYTVLHRSDLLMKDHMKHVRNLQEAFRVALANLEHARTSTDVERWTAAAAELKEKTEQMVLILQVLKKLNTELSYARSDLNDALYKGVGDINAARKRVIWLEDKMGELCGKRRLKSQLMNHSHEELDEPFAENKTRLPLGSAQRSHPLAQDKQEVVEGKVQHMASFTKQPGSDAMEKPGNGAADMDGKDSSVDRTNKDQFETSQQFGKIGGYVGEFRAQSAVFSDGDTQSLHSGTSELQLSLRPDHVYGEVFGNNDDEGGAGGQGSKETGVPTTFITELADTTQTSGENQGVKMELIRTQKQEESNKTEDAAQLYWQSEHHRFEYTNLSSSASEIDPLSYNRMGLAVPDSFLKKNIPWKAHLKSTDIKDIHREALDKLALRVFSMQDQIYEAAMLSVLRSPPPDEEPQASFLQNLDKTQTETSISLGMTVKSKSVLSASHESGSEIHKKALGTEKRSMRTPVHLVFHPKPLSPPKLLPLPRTNLNKEFPPYASAFANPDPSQRAPAERIADQRNLIEETKLVLYRQKPKPDTPRHSSMERQFHKMIEYDRMQSQKASGPKLPAEQNNRRKIQSQFKTASTTTAAPSNWSVIKPHSRGKEYSGLRWERVKGIVHENLISTRVEERIDAAKQLGTLRCGDTMVFYALKERLHQDTDQRVQYEAAKSLILLGCWEDEIMQVVLKYLVLGNTEIRLDLITTLTDGKNVQFVDKSIPTLVELVKVLSHFCCNPDPDDYIAVDAAVLLGRLCVQDASAEARLLKALQESSNTHIKAKALEILVKQFGRANAMVVGQIVHQLRTSPVWRHRVSAASLLISLGPNHKFVKDNMGEIYSVLKQKLWDDPNSEVRLSAAKTLTALGMFTRACEEVENYLEDSDENVRAEAVISVGTLGLKNDRVIRLLLEMLELDSSEFVRLMIVRTFVTLKTADRRVLRTLRERERLDGALARESQKALRVLDNLTTTPTSRALGHTSLNPSTPKKAGGISPKPG